jgi:hypothetical protein
MGASTKETPNMVIGPGQFERPHYLNPIAPPVRSHSRVFYRVRYS